MKQDFSQSKPPNLGQIVLTPTGRRATVDDVKEAHGTVRCTLIYHDDGEEVDLQPELLKKA